MRKFTRIWSSAVPSIPILRVLCLGTGEIWWRQALPVADTQQGRVTLGLLKDQRTKYVKPAAVAVEADGPPGIKRRLIPHTQPLAV